MIARTRHHVGWAVCTGVLLGACSAAKEPIAPARATAPAGAGYSAFPVWPGLLSGVIIPPSRVNGVQGATGHAAYVSLAPGTFASATGALITSTRIRSAGYTATASIVDGGFDPVAIAAEIGDTLTIELRQAAGAPLLFTRIVSATTPLLVVRTEPPAHSVEVPLNAPVMAVFSEPVNAAQQAGGAMSILRGSAMLGGRLESRDLLGVTLEFFPDSALAAGTTYALDLTQDIITLDGRSLTIPMRSEFTTMLSPQPSALMVQDFSMVEFVYPSAPTWWYYAPQIRVAASSSVESVTITRLDVTIPGFTRTPGVCSRGIRVFGGQSRSLVGEIYGDYELTFDAHGARAAPGDATVFITYIDETGRLSTLTARGPIVPGTLPTTYTGGTSSMSPMDCPHP